MPFCCGRPAADAKLYVLNGTDLTAITNRLQQEIPALKHFASHMEYLPGDVVPLSSMAKTPKERIVALVDRAVEVAGAGMPAMITSDAWGNHAHAAAHVLHGSNMAHVPTVYALVHQPLSTLVANARRENKGEQLLRYMTDFGALYVGVPNKTAGHLGYMSVKDVHKAVNAFDGLLGTDLAPTDLDTVKEIAKKYLLTSLGLSKSPNGVYLMPRGSYDMIVDGSRANKVSASLRTAMGASSVLKKEVLGSNFVINVTYPHFCKACVQGVSMGESQPYMCGQCLGHMHEITEKH